MLVQNKCKYDHEKQAVRIWPLNILSYQSVIRLQILRAAKLANASTGSPQINTELRVASNIQNAIGGTNLILYSVSSFGTTSITTVLFYFYLIPSSCK